MSRRDAGRGGEAVTFYLCHCGSVHDSAETRPCVRLVRVGTDGHILPRPVAVTALTIDALWVEGEFVNVTAVES